MEWEWVGWTHLLPSCTGQCRHEGVYDVGGAGVEWICCICFSPSLPSHLSPQTTEGYLEFYDTGEPNSPTCQLMSTPEHADMTDLEWDPTGRFVTTSISYWSNKVCRGEGRGGAVVGCVVQACYPTDRLVDLLLTVSDCCLVHTCTHTPPERHWLHCVVFPREAALQTASNNGEVLSVSLAAQTTPPPH